MPKQSPQCELTILMPCLNEAETLATCIRKAADFLTENRVDGEILIADNGSTDGSVEIALSEGARVIHVDSRGYGAALIGGCNEAYGRYVIMGDADDSYDFTSLMPFLERLRAGDELVMGNRFRGGIEKGAMPPLHRYLGNPVLSFLGRLLFRSPIKDFHCGLRGYNAEAMRRLNLQTLGMEYASEMVVQATLCGLKVSEVPTTLARDGRSRPPHLRSWRDGWRHLKFLLIYSPNWLFLYPGLALMCVGLLLTILLEVHPIVVGTVTFDINTLLYSTAMVTVGTNLVLFSVFTKVYAIHSNFIKTNERFLSWFKTENCAPLGILLTLIGIGLSIFSVVAWGRDSFGELIPHYFMRITIPAVAIIIIGIQLIFSGFFIDVLRIKKKNTIQENEDGGRRGKDEERIA